MAKIPSGVTDIKYSVPLTIGDRVVGVAKISVDHIDIVGGSGNYIANLSTGSDIELQISDRQTHNKLASDLLKGVSLVLEVSDDAE